MAYPQGNQGGQIDHPQGTTILILGILGLVVCGICAPFAWVMGNKAKKEIDANPGRYRNAGNVNIGRILGMIGTILILVGIALSVLIIVLSAGSSS